MSRTAVARLAFVDSLRLVAAGLVVFQHISDRLKGSGNPTIAAWGPGVGGVILFFLISGFVIPFSVQRGFDARTFALRRVFRIYPLYLVTLVAALAGGASGLLPQWADLTHADAWRWIANLLLVQDFVGQKAIIGVSWTLFIELAWYGLFGAALLLARHRAAQWLAVLAPLCLLALAATSLLLDTRIPLSRPGLIYAAVIGFQAYRCWIGEITWRDLALSLAGFVLVTGACNLIAFGHFSHPHVTLLQAAGPWLLAPLAFTVMVFVAQRRPLRLLSQGIAPQLGAASYSLYLLHPLIMAALFSWLPPMAAAVLAVPTSVILALAAYRWIELPGIALGRRLAQISAADRAVTA